MHSPSPPPHCLCSNWVFPAKTPLISSKFFKGPESSEPGVITGLSLPHHFQPKGGNLFRFSWNKPARLAREIPRKNEQTFPERWVMTSRWKGVAEAQQHLPAQPSTHPDFGGAKSSTCPRRAGDVPATGAGSTNAEPHPQKGEKCWFRGCFWTGKAF